MTNRKRNHTQPRVLEGEGFGIIEDCGGPGGLAELRAAFEAKAGEEYENLREWLGVDELNLARFDLDDMNFRLKKLLEKPLHVTGALALRCQQAYQFPFPSTGAKPCAPTSKKSTARST